mgnify:CR=1 FL=1
MAAPRVSKGFKDISLSFDMHPITKDILILKNEDAIKKSVRNIVQTIPGERFFNSTFGSTASTSLFDFVDYGTATSLQTQIEIAIQNYESRVTNIKVQVNPRPDDNTFEVQISYEIIGQEFTPQTFTYLLEATRR